MNSTLKNALSASVALAGAVTSAYAQFDYDPNCIDPNNTAPYSVDYNSYFLKNDLWGAGLGIQGTVAYKFCTPGEKGATIPVRGRMGFTTGNTYYKEKDNNTTVNGVTYLGGSIQDDIQGLTYPDGAPFTDDDLKMNWGMNDFDAGGAAPSGGGWTFARVHVKDATGAETSTLFGANGMNLAFYGASNRYMFAQTANGNIGIRCVIDVLGDAARVSWRLTNNGTTQTSLGLWFHQWVVITDKKGNTSEGDTPVGPKRDRGGAPYSNNGFAWNQPYITTSTGKPISTDKRFIRSQDPLGFPETVNWSMNRTLGFGLQTVNGPTPDTSDENGNSDAAAVDEFAIGDGTNLLGGIRGSATDPKPNDFVFPDANFGPGGSTFIQKWYPTPVAAGASRDIITYYRSTWGDSNYAGGYSAVVDTPKALSTDPANPGTFLNNPFVIRVNVDNTGGFGIVDKTVQMNNVKVTLQLPQGMHDPNNPSSRTLVKYIGRIDPVNIGVADFNVAADSSAFGTLPYTVTIEPSPGAPKTITGTINVAATPVLLLNAGANLVTSPWTFTDSTWDTILGQTFNTDFQAFTWDPQQSQYVIQTGPERGRGTWIIEQNDLGYHPLSGNPTQPIDEFPDPTNYYSGGAPLIQLHAGWNLVGNPYNYAFPLGQLVGVLSGTSSALTYADMVSQGVIDGAFAYYDQNQRTYHFFQTASDRLQPNYGYWVYSTQDLTLQFPPIYDLFTRGAAPTTFRQNAKHWRLQLSASNATQADTDNFIGHVDDGSLIQTLNARKAPMSPLPNAIRAFFTGRTSGNEYTQLLRNGMLKQVYTFNVTSRNAGPVTITWPNIKQIPSNLNVRIKDMHTKALKDMRSVAGLTFVGGTNTTHQFEVVVTPRGASIQRIGSVATRLDHEVTTRSLAIKYLLAARGTSSVRILQDGVEVANVVGDHDSDRGMNTVNWPCTLSNGESAPNGKYVVEVTATGEGGDVTTKKVQVTLK